MKENKGIKNNKEQISHKKREKKDPRKPQYASYQPFAKSLFQCIEIFVYTVALPV
jgi:hypothetical protein